MGWAMKVRFGRGRTPDPQREGTIYRAGPGFKLRGDEAQPELPQGAVPPPPPYPGAVRTSGQGGAPVQLDRPPSPRSSRDSRTSRGKVIRRVIIALVVLLLVYPLALAGIAYTSLNRFDAQPTGGQRPAGAATRTYLVIGSDGREGLTRAQRAELGTGQADGQRTDTIMIMQTPLNGPPTLVSLPRDSYVAIPGHGKNKINAAYAIGGAKLLVSTVEQNTGLHIDDVVMTGFEGFATMVDAVGGVVLCPKTAMKDAKAHLDVKAGCQTMDGKTALGYARARYSDPRGDLGRVERQQQVIAAIAKKTFSPSVIALPWRSFAAATAGGKALTVDSSTTPWGLFRFLNGMRQVSSGIRMTVPIAGDISTSAGDSLKWNSTEANKLFEAMERGDTATVKAIAAEQAKKA